MQADAFLFQHARRAGRRRGGRGAHLRPHAARRCASSAPTSSPSRSRPTASTWRRSRARSRPGARPKLAHIIPNFQNPAGCTLSLEKRKRLLELARASTASRSSRTTRTWSSASRASAPDDARARTAARRVVYASSFSKTVCPGIRVGYLVGPADLIAGIRKLATEHLHLAEHGGPVDRGRVLPLGRDRALDRDRQGGPARAPRRHLRGARAPPAGRQLRDAARAATSSGSTCPRAPTWRALEAAATRARRDLREGHATSSSRAARARFGSPTPPCHPTRSRRASRAWPMPTASWPAPRAAGADRAAAAGSPATSPRSSATRCASSCATPGCSSCCRQPWSSQWTWSVEGIGLEMLTGSYDDSPALAEAAVPTVVGFLVVTPLITAICIYALRSIAEGERPARGQVVRGRLRGVHAALRRRCAGRARHRARLPRADHPGHLPRRALVFVPQAVVIDGARGPAALRRSSEVVQGFWWRTFGLVVLVNLAVAIPGLILLAPVHRDRGEHRPVASGRSPARSSPARDRTVRRRSTRRSSTTTCWRAAAPSARLTLSALDCARGADARRQRSCPASSGSAGERCARQSSMARAGARLQARAPGQRCHHRPRRASLSTMRRPDAVRRGLRCVGRAAPGRSAHGPRRRARLRSLPAARRRAEQHVEHLLDRLARVAGLVDRGDATLDAFDHRPHREGQRPIVAVVARGAGSPAGLRTTVRVQAWSTPWRRITRHTAWASSRRRSS